MNLARLEAMLGLIAFCYSASPVPNAPTNLQASVVSPIQINLVWSDASSDETRDHVLASICGGV